MNSSTAAASKIFSFPGGQSAFPIQLGHVFGAHSLPNHLSSLAGSLYYADNDDGTLRLVSPKLAVSGQGDCSVPYADLQDVVDKYGGLMPTLRIGNAADWGSLLSSIFRDSANLDIGQEKLYWTKGARNAAGTLVMDVSDGTLFQHSKEKGAHGRLFVNLPRHALLG